MANSRQDRHASMVSNPLTDRRLGSPAKCRAADSPKPMLIVCPSCATSYDVTLASLGPKGRQVRCVRCQTVWHAAPTHADSLMAAAEALAPGRALPGDGAQPRAALHEADPDGISFDGDVRQDEAATQAAAGAWFEPPDKLPPGGETQREASESALANEYGETISAESVAAVEAPPIAPVDLDEGQPPPLDIDADDFAELTAAPVADVETEAARGQSRRTEFNWSLWPLSAFQSAILALIIIDAALIGWRADVVRAMPQTASFYAMFGLPVNLRGLDFGDVKTMTEKHEGVQILVVEGNVVNDSRKIVDVPRIKFVLRNAERQEIYSWTAVPSTAALPPGQAVAFSARLASPPAGSRDVVVRFITRRDLVAASR
jgi:predicted Zn finger-like uncharacterized protein